VLGRSPLNNAGILRIRAIIIRLRAKNPKVEIEGYGMTSDAKVFKTCSEKIHGGHVAYQRMFGDRLADNAVGCQNVEDVSVVQPCPGLVLRFPATCV